jgi:hypothetical protein
VLEGGIQEQAEYYVVLTLQTGNALSKREIPENT